MKLTVVQCDCGNPEPHRKLRAEDGRETPSGFFSITDGKRIHAGLLASGKAQQTEEEKVATEQEIDSCGLPAEYEPEELSETLTPGDELFRELSGALFQMLQMLVGERPLEAAADALRREFPPAEHKGMVAKAVKDGVFTEEEGEQILAFVKAATPATVPPAESAPAATAAAE
jgi:hypothetical protein